MASKNKSFADDGWAIWVEGDDNSTVYINDWLNPKGRSYVDLAVRIRGVRASRTLNVYVPFIVERDEIEDTSLRLSDENILRATFSAACIIDYMKNECTSEIAYNGRTIDLVHVSKLGFSVDVKETGSLITVDLDKLQPYIDNDESYFLIRMPHKSLDEVFGSRTDVGNTIQRFRDLLTSPVVAENYGYSIRINEGRLLPSFINRSGAFNRQKLKKAVITISIDESYEFNDSNCYRICRLEEALYRDYAPDKFECDNVIVYQWNQSRSTNSKGHFNFYFDIDKNSVSKGSMTLYLFLLFVMGILGDAIWDFIKWIFGIF